MVALVTRLFFTGCTKTVWISPEQLQPEEKVKVVVAADGHEVKPDRTTLRGDTIYAELAGETLRFPLNDVGRVVVEHLGQLKTAILVASVVALGAVVAVGVAYVKAVNDPLY